METLKCHSNETTWATIIKNNIYVAVNVMNMYAKNQLHPPIWFLRKRFFKYFFQKYLILP